MTDKELLALAVKAAGFVDTNRIDDWVWVLTESGVWNWWNPLNDDGDALRLALKLKLAIIPTGVAVNVSEIGGRSSIEITGDDPCAATRRAIVRAAAEIGRGME